MKARLLLGALLTLFTGCVADTMRGYVGQDIRAVMLAYGPPANEIDLGGGSRAFQWSKTSVDTTPLSAVTTTDKDKKGRSTTQTHDSPHFQRGPKVSAKTGSSASMAANRSINGSSRSSGMVEINS
jgi:hypothetical protein